MNFGTVYLFSAAYSADQIFAISIFPHPPQLFDLQLNGTQISVLGKNAEDAPIA